MQSPLPTRLSVSTLSAAAESNPTAEVGKYLLLRAPSTYFPISFNYFLYLETGSRVASAGLELSI